jgi:hypothetical protein
VVREDRIDGNGIEFVSDRAVKRDSLACEACWRTHVGVCFDKNRCGACRGTGHSWQKCPAPRFGPNAKASALQLGPGTKPPPEINHRRKDALGEYTRSETPSAIHMPAVWVKGLRASVAAITPSASDDALAELTASARCAAVGAGGAAYTLPIEATVNGTFVQALGDTGANVSLIDAEVAASLQLKGTPCTVRAASHDDRPFRRAGLPCRPARRPDPGSRLDPWDGRAGALGSVESLVLDRDG